VGENLVRKFFKARGLLYLVKLLGEFDG